MIKWPWLFLCPRQVVLFAHSLSAQMDMDDSDDRNDSKDRCFSRFNPCKKGTGILAGSRREFRFPPRSRRDLASPGIFPPGSRQEKNPAIDPAGTPTANLCLHRDPAKNPDYPEIPPGSCQPGYFPAGILLRKKSRHKSCRDSHRES